MPKDVAALPLTIKKKEVDVDSELCDEDVVDSFVLDEPRKQASEPLPAAQAPHTQLLPLLSANGGGVAGYCDAAGLQQGRGGVNRFVMQSWAEMSTDSEKEDTTKSVTSVTATCLSGDDDLVSTDCETRKMKVSDVDIAESISASPPLAPKEEPASESDQKSSSKSVEDECQGESDMQLLPDDCWPECVKEVSADMENISTVMVRNLPNKYTQQMLLRELQQAGFRGAFDFLYLPIDARTSGNKGYAFVNFINPGWAELFKQLFDAKRMANFNSNKFVAVSPAVLQGFQANLDHYSNSRVSHGDPAVAPMFLRQSDTQRKARRHRRRSQLSRIDEAAAAAGRQVNFCPFCGTKVEYRTSRFCHQCGKRLRT